MFHAPERHHLEFQQYPPTCKWKKQVEEFTHLHTLTELQINSKRLTMGKAGLTAIPIYKTYTFLPQLLLFSDRAFSCFPSVWGQSPPGRPSDSNCFPERVWPWACRWSCRCGDGDLCGHWAAVFGLVHLSVTRTEGKAVPLAEKARVGGMNNSLVSNLRQHSPGSSGAAWNCTWVAHQGLVFISITINFLNLVGNVTSCGQRGNKLGIKRT